MVYSLGPSWTQFDVLQKVLKGRRGSHQGTSARTDCPTQKWVRWYVFIGRLPYAEILRPPRLAVLNVLIRSRRCNSLLLPLDQRSLAAKSKPLFLNQRKMQSNLTAWDLQVWLNDQIRFSFLKGESNRLPSYEIDHERYALKALRRDFDSVGHDRANAPAVLLQAAESR